ncbi:MAG: hypothetical protein ABIQ88_23360 [Chitinophagaceae bacterium]
MKTFFLFVMMAAAVSAHAQYNDADNINGGNLRAGVAYVHDFPGVRGTAVYAQYSFPLNDWLQGGFGVKHISTSGYPRTSTVREYTKANAIDFELLFVPLRTENASLRLGLGYTFSFYNIRRSYPLYATHSGLATDVTYPIADSKGKVHGTSIIAEYEYYFSNNFSAGVKVQVCKAYDSIVMGGPFVAIKL